MTLFANLFRHLPTEREAQGVSHSTNLPWSCACMIFQNDLENPEITKS